MDRLKSITVLEKKYYPANKNVGSFNNQCISLYSSIVVFEMMYFSIISCTLARYKRTTESQIEFLLRFDVANRVIRQIFGTLQILSTK
jgi:hypothetical protein